MLQSLKREGRDKAGAVGLRDGMTPIVGTVPIYQPGFTNTLQHLARTVMICAQVRSFQTSRTLPHGLMSSYSYQGLKTEITVNGNRTMSRTYNSRKWLLETEDALGNVNRFSYDATGRPLVIQDAEAHQILAYYNGFGHKTQVDDPNQGVTQFKYNTLGELAWQQDANGVQQTNALDTLGRVTQRQIEGGNQPHTATFVWDTLKKGLLTQESANGVVRGYQYDALSRLTQTTVTQSGQVFSIQQHYDSLYGRIKGLEYPNGLTLQYEYNDSGYLTQTKNAASGYVYQEVTAMDWAGRITGANLAESQLERLSLYDTDSSVMLSTQVTKNGSVIHAHDYTLFDDYKNLLQEQNRVTGLEKNYGYDELNRLTSYNFSNQTPNFDQWVYYDYDATGNLLKKTDYSEDKDDAYRYGGDTACNANANAGSNAVCRIEKLDSTIVHFKYDNRGNLLTGDGLTLNYNHMDKPLTVARNSSVLSAANSDFIYGSDGMRAKQVRTANGSTLTTYYVDKLYELDSDGSWRAFIDNVAVLSYTPERKHQILFTLRDRLGSATTLVDHNGSTVSQRYFDPFGRAANAAYSHNSSIMAGESFTDAMLDLADTNRYRRGFTDHEHLNEQQIIHMNGRVYDYNLGRFLSVDPVIQAPTSTQSPNPYSYIMNNPLAGIDPTGYSSCDPDSTKCKTEIKISQTGSAIKKSVTATTTSDGNGGATITFSGADKGSRVAARNAVAGKLTSAGFQVSNVGSPGAVSNQPTYGNDPNFQAGFGSIKGDAAAF